MPPEHCNISIFYDDFDDNVYLTNFVFDQTVRDDPVDLIVVFEDDIQVSQSPFILIFIKILIPTLLF